MLNLEFNGLSIHALGDPHLGRQFTNGTPIHRRGDRERMQWIDFKTSLHTDCDIHVCMGDLFDKFTVPNNIVMRVVQEYVSAIASHPDRPFVLLRGNHDASTDLERVSSFSVLGTILRSLGVTVVDEEPVSKTIKGTRLTFLPWHPVLSASEIAEAAPEGDVVFGHWDVVTIDNHFNKLPAAILARKGYQKIVTGHDHGRREIQLEGIPVQVTGSMQPYSHAEDSNGDLYVTITPEEYRASPDSYINKFVRILLKTGEVFDDVVNCLNLTIKTIDEDDPEDIDMEVGFEKFDMATLTRQVLEEEGVDPDFLKLTETRIDEERLGDFI